MLELAMAGKLRHLMNIYGKILWYWRKKIWYLMRFFCVALSSKSFYYKSWVVYGVTVYAL